jgi:hypothetical protein
LPPCRLVRGWWSWFRRMLCRRCSEACWRVPYRCGCSARWMLGHLATLSGTCRRCGRASGCLAAVAPLCRLLAGGSYTVVVVFFIGSWSAAVVVMLCGCLRYRLWWFSLSFYGGNVTSFCRINSLVACRVVSLRSRVPHASSVVSVCCVRSFAHLCLWL